ncbi:hypothetical protein ACRAWF_23800 [Streptomyces sp. L7]
MPRTERSDGTSLPEAALVVGTVVGTGDTSSRATTPAGCTTAVGQPDGQGRPAPRRPARRGRPPLPPMFAGTVSPPPAPQDIRGAGREQWDDGNQDNHHDHRPARAAPT